MSANSFKPLAPGDESVSLGKLSQLTGFPEEFIKRELLLNNGEALPLSLLRERVLSYLDGIYGVEADDDRGQEISTLPGRKRAS